MSKKKKINDDSRVLSMAKCMIFALQSTRDKPMFDGEKQQMTTWHAWFKEVLNEAGFTDESGSWMKSIDDKPPATSAHGKST